MPLETAAHKPGKWLRSSSRDLNPSQKVVPAAPQACHDMMNNPFMQMMCAMVMQGQGQQHHQGGANAINLKVYNTNQRKAIPAIEDAPAKVDEPSEAKVAEDPPAAPAPAGFALFTLPTAADDSQEAAEAMVEEHRQTMNQAYGARPKGCSKDGTEVSAAVRARFPERFSKCRWVRGCARSCFDLNRRRLDGCLCPTSWLH